MNRLSTHLTYANVMATIAVFIAIGGTSYAAVRISGQDITNHSISVAKLTRNIVVPGARKDLQVKLTSSRTRPHKGRLRPGHHSGLYEPDGSRAGYYAAMNSRKVPSDASGDGGSGSLITMSVGQTVTALQDGPFTISANCVSTHDGSEIQFLATSSDPWYTNNYGGFAAGDTVQLNDYSGASGIFIQTQPLVDATTGASYVVQVLFGVGVGADCDISAAAIG